MEKKNNLRIFFYGKDALKDVHQFCKDLNKEEKIRINNVEYFYTKDNESSWEFLIFPNEINNEDNKAIQSILEKDYQSENTVEVNKKIKKIIKEHIDDKDNSLLDKELSKLLIKNRKFYDVLVISIDNLLDEDSKSAFLFFQGFTDLFSQQPFFLFLTKKEENPNVLTLFQFVTNEFFDKRNVYAYKFPTNDEEKKNINNFLIYSMNYYQEIGETGNQNSSQTFNILICGPAGVGKSSFINQFLQEKRAKEGEGLSVTHEITSYVHSKYPIRIFDTPGFEGNETVSMVQKTLEQFEKDIAETKNHFDLIIYLAQLKMRTFFDLEIELIKSLIQKNKKMIFVLNNFGISKKESNKLKKIYQTSITQIVKSIGNFDNSKLKDILDNIIIICLKQKRDEDSEEEEEDKIKIKQGYGMDKLFQKLHDLFVPDKIGIDDIENAETVEEIIDVIKKYKIISYIQKIEDITVNLQIELSKEILSYSKYDKFVWFFRDSRRKELLQLINEKNNGPKIEDIDNLYSNIESEIKKLTDDDKKKIKSQFFDSIKNYKRSFNTEGFPFDAWFYNEYTFLVGNMYLKTFTKEYGKYDKQAKKFLKKLSTALNSAIDSLGDLAEEWKEIYESLKAHKSDKEWVNKFFIVEIPKPIK